MRRAFKADYYRMTGKKWSITRFADLILRYDLRYLYNMRRPKGKIQLMLAMRAARKYGLEILSHNIGEGLYIGHAHNINVHPEAVLGKNCNLNKGCTIGRENRGRRNGAPVLGDQVWVGANAVVVGKITIGNDVLIAPNAYVNFDVPDHSIVIGNPAIIKPCDKATLGYVQYMVE